MKERLHYVDVCKGILILLVIWQHIPLFAQRSGVDSEVLGNLGWGWSFWFVCFYMQAFFFANGYTSNFNKNFKPFLWSCFKALIIPYIAFALIGKAFNALLWGDPDLWIKTAGVGDQVWFFMEESYWFLSALFIARIVYWFLTRYIKNDYWRGAAALVVMLIGFFLNHIYDGISSDPAHYNNHLHYRNALCMMFFIWGGYYMSIHKEKMEKYIIYISIAFIVLVIATHLIGKACAPSYTHSCNIPYYRIPLYIFYATAGTVFMFWVAKIIKANRVLEYLGKGSLVIYMCHFGFLRLVTKYLPLVISPYGEVSGVVFFFTTLLLVALLSTAMIWLFNHKYLRVLIGKF